MQNDGPPRREQPNLLRDYDRMQTDIRLPLNVPKKLFLKNKLFLLMFLIFEEVDIWKKKQLARHIRQSRSRLM